jgi:peptidoglycan/LPS O-acetylase OafA/YrhL
MLSPAPQDTSFLNLFRGFAALWVALAHCFIWGKGNVDPYFLLEPKKAVDLFMVLSGFLMIYTIDRGREAGEDPGSWRTWRTFYIRRYFRIAPVYYLALAAVILLWIPLSAGMDLLLSQNPEKWAADKVYGPQYQDFGPASMLLHISFLFGLSPDLSYSTSLPDWSLSLEMQFYALFPVFYIAARRYPLWLSAALLGLGAILLTKAYSVGVGLGWWPAFDEPSLLIMKLPMFLVGMLIYEAGRKRSLLCLGVAGALLLLACRGYGLSATFLVLLVAGLAALWLLGTPARLTKVTGSRLVRFLSDSSYAVYLIHGLVLAMIGSRILAGLNERGFSPDAAVAALIVTVLPLSYAIAWAAYRWVELPGIALGKTVALREAGRGDILGGLRPRQAYGRAATRFRRALGLRPA